LLPTDGRTQSHPTKKLQNSRFGGASPQHQVPIQKDENKGEEASGIDNDTSKNLISPRAKRKPEEELHPDSPTKKQRTDIRKSSEDMDVDTAQEAKEKSDKYGDRSRSPKKRQLSSSDTPDKCSPSKKQKVGCTPSEENCFSDDEVPSEDDEKVEEEGEKQKELEEGGVESRQSSDSDDDDDDKSDSNSESDIESSDDRSDTSQTKRKKSGVKLPGQVQKNSQQKSGNRGGRERTAKKATNYKEKAQTKSVCRNFLQKK
jgi:hypothetical protein